MKGILFKPDMIKAVVEGRKTVTRREESSLKNINQNPEKWHLFQCQDGFWGWTDGLIENMPEFVLNGPGKRPRYLPGETVYIKEAHYAYGEWSKLWSDNWQFYRKEYTYIRFEDDKPEKILKEHREREGWYLRSPLFLKAIDARYFLKIKDVRPERLQEINSDRHDEVLKEGYPFIYDINTLNEHPVNTYARYWNSINGKGSWESNPWVWRYEFERVEK